MYWVTDEAVYFVDADGACHGVEVTAKDRVVEVRELESVTFTCDKAECELPEGATRATSEEVIAKFHVSELHPVPAPKAKPKGKKE